jgi:hypothetical protein
LSWFEEKSYWEDPNKMCEKIACFDSLNMSLIVVKSSLLDVVFLIAVNSAL